MTKPQQLLLAVIDTMASGKFGGEGVIARGGRSQRIGGRQIGAPVPPDDGTLAWCVSFRPRSGLTRHVSVRCAGGCSFLLVWVDVVCRVSSRDLRSSSRTLSFEHTALRRKEPAPQNRAPNRKSQKWKTWPKTPRPAHTRPEARTFAHRVRVPDYK